jgi:hypothetical protein
MAIGDDFSIDVSGNIRHVSGSTTYTVLAFHRWLQDLADDAESTGNDLVDITSSTPSDRATDNIVTLNSPYNIDDVAAEYLYDGSITQEGGDKVYSGLVVVGSLYGTTTLQIVQNNYLYDGDSPFWGTGLNADAAANILMRCLIKTRSGGSNIDNQKIRVFAREWGETWAEFEVTMGLGNSTAAIFTNQDLNNQTAVGTVSGWTTITNTEGYQLIDILNGAGDREYYSQWTKDIYTLNQMYERCKYLARRGTAETMHGMDGELFRGITHQWDYDQESGSGSPVEDEELSWGTGTSYGEGVLLALDDNGTSGTMWIQLIRGVAPVDGMQVRGDQSGGSSTLCNVNGSVTSRSVSPVFLGQSTGAAIIGAFGIGIDKDDLTSSDLLFDLTGTQQQPPNNVQFIVYGLVSGQDRVLVTNNDPASGAGTAIHFDQMSLNTALTGASEVAVDVGTGNIPSDTPATGVLRIETNGGRYQYCTYTAHDGDDGFTIDAENFSGDNADVGNNVFLGYIDKLATSTQESVTIQYDQARTMFVRVRDGGGTPIKTYEATAPLGTGGGSATANRISDT